MDNTITSLWYPQQLHNKALFSLREKAIWTQSPSGILHNHIQWMSPWTSCMICLVAILFTWSAVCCTCTWFWQPSLLAMNPQIIYSGANSKVVCSAQTSMLFETYKWKLTLLLKISQMIYCVIWIKTLSFTWNKSTRMQNAMMITFSEATNTQIHFENWFSFTNPIHVHCYIFL